MCGIMSVEVFMNQEEQQKLTELIRLAKQKEPYQEMTDEELSQLIFKNCPNVYMIDTEGNVFHQTLPIDQHHYLGYLNYLKYLMEQEPDKHKSMSYLLDMDFSKNPKAGVLVTTKLGKYFQNQGDIVIQTWINPYDMNTYFMNTTTENITPIQQQTFKQILEAHEMNEIDPIENGRLGTLRKKEVSFEHEKLL